MGKHQHFHYYMSCLLLKDALSYSQCSSQRTGFLFGIHYQLPLELINGENKEVERIVVVVKLVRVYIVS